MKFWLWLALGCLATLRAEDTSAAFEHDLAGRVASSRVTVVHFWAPWCPNCKAELTPEGWAKFIADHPDVDVVFINIWHQGQDGAARLAAGGLGQQPNFTALTHPNPSRKAAERVTAMLGLPISWIPTTWIFRDGKMRYAMNYGEMRFAVLDRLVRDAADAWDR